MLELINFTDLSDKEKIIVLEWRNNPKIRKWMKNRKEISLDEHLKFLSTLQGDASRDYFIVKKDRDYIGVIDLNRNSLGIYANPNSRRVGDFLLEAIIKFGFDTKKLAYLRAEVFQQNSKAINLYKRHNFKTIKKTGELLIMELKNENS